MRERALLAEFERLGFSHLSGNHDRLGLICIAQHFGLPTRLLDWTRSFLTAAFFAVERNNGRDNAAVYELRQDRLGVYKGDMEKVEEDAIVLPRRLTDRIRAQQSVFTIHKDPTANLRVLNLVKHIIPVDICPVIRRQLHQFGIDRAFLFPDLDGIGLTRI